MTNHGNFIRQAFAELVSVDAWHKPLDGKTKTVDVHADVVFGEARVSGDGSPVRFRLRLRRATLIVKVPETEPGSIPKSSVYRAESQTLIELTRRTTEKTQLDAHIHASAGIGHTGVKAEAKMEADARASASCSEEAKSVQKIRPVVADYRYDREQDAHAWDFKSAIDPHLLGRPWDGASQVILTLHDERAKATKSLAPALQVCLVYRREDLIIEDIELTDESRWNKVKASLSGSKMKAAEAYIREELLRNGLAIGDLKDKFSQITFVDMLATAEGV